MSYILDALRKAEAQRARGAIPGLHAPSLAIPVPDAGAPARRSLAAWAGLGVLVLAGVAAAGWKLGQRDEPPVASSTALGNADARLTAPTVLAAPQVQSQPSAPVSPMAQPTLPRVAQGVPQAPSELLTVSPARSPRTTAQTVPNAALPAASSVAQQHQRLAAVSPLATAQAPLPGGAAQADRIPSFNELPEATQRLMPKLAVGGSIYSDDPGARFLIVNGETFHQGDRVAADLVLEQIHAKEAVLAFKGQRFRLAL